MRLDLRDSILDVLGSIANGGVRQQIEIESDTRELVEMVHSLRANNFLGCCYNTKRNQAGHVTRSRGDGSPTRSARAEIAARATADVKIVQVVRVRALFVFNFKNDLVLVVRLLDEIDIVLGVGVAHQALNRRSRNAICG